jgi:anti-anti-sigma regulatory factor
MSFKVERIPGCEPTVFAISGRIQAEQLQTLRAALATEHGEIVFDLKEVKLVDRDGIAFLAGCESSGVELRNCPPYVREWIFREKSPSTAGSSGR